MDDRRIDLLWLLIFAAMAVSMVVSALKPKGGLKEVKALPVVIMNPDGTMVTFGSQPLIQTDTKE